MKSPFVKKATACILIAAMAAACLSGCGNQDKIYDGSSDQEKVLRASLDVEPPNLDPWQNLSGAVSSVISSIHEPLLKPTGMEGNGWEPGLATDYQCNENRTIHTVTLRREAEWEDGTPITASDVVYSFQRVLDPSIGSQIVQMLLQTNITNAEAVYTGEMDPDELGVTALDDHTVQITTDLPCDYFDQVLSSAFCAPLQQTAAEEFGDIYGSDVGKTMASGPFKLEEWVHENTIVLVKNKNYWDARNVALDRIEFTITSDANTLAGMYQTGELDILRVPDDQIAMYQDEPGFTANRRLKVNFIEFNPYNEFLANRKIREALAISFDRMAYAENVAHSPELAAYGMVPPGVPGLDGGDFREQQGDLMTDCSTDIGALERARVLLQEGLDELGRTMSDLESGVTVQCLSTEAGKLQAQSVQGMWKENLGLDFPVQPLEIGVLLPMLISGDFDCVIGGSTDADYADPSTFLYFIYAQGKWDDTKFLELMQQVQAQYGEERTKTWMEIEKLVLENCIYIPQVYEQHNWVISPRVEGLKIFPVGWSEFDYKYVNIVE